MKSRLGGVRVLLACAGALCLRPAFAADAAEADPSVGPAVAFNWDHESDPLCGKDWTAKFVERIGRANFRAFAPRGPDGKSCAAPPAAPGTGEEPSHAGLGPDQLDHTCPAAAHASASNATKTDAVLDQARGQTLP